MLCRSYSTWHLQVCLVVLYRTVIYQPKRKITIDRPHRNSDPGLILPFFFSIPGASICKVGKKRRGPTAWVRSPLSWTSKFRRKFKPLRAVSWWSRRDKAVRWPVSIMCDAKDNGWADHSWPILCYKLYYFTESWYTGTKRENVGWYREVGLSLLCGEMK